MGHSDNGILWSNEKLAPKSVAKYSCHNVKCQDKKRHTRRNQLSKNHIQRKETEKFKLYLHYFILENFLKCIALIVRKYYLK